MRYLLCISVILCGLFQQTVYAEDKSVQTDEEATGFGLGAVIGGLVAGPPGIIVGAAMGSAIGHDNSQQADSIADLKQKLSSKDDELRSIAKQIADLNSEHQQALKQVSLEKQHQADEFLSDNLALSVFFRTDKSTVEPAFNQSIDKLAALIKDRPEIRIYVNAYTDERGAKQYNQKLSEDRANSVINKLVSSGIEQNRIQFHAFGETRVKATNDLDGYAFDRRVDIELSIQDEA